MRKLATVLILGVWMAGCQRALVAAPPTRTAVALDTPTATVTQVPTVTPTPACLESEGRIETSAYTSPLLDQEIALTVYLPPCYDAAADDLPSLYLFHGKPYDMSHWLSLGAEASLDQGLAAGEWGPAVVIFPNLPEPLFSQSDGGPGSYEQEFLEGLVPFVEANYRVLPDPERRSIAGISRGGIWALEIGLFHPDMFGVVGGISPALSVNYPRPAYDPFELVRSVGPGVSLYLFAGDTDWARAQTERLATDAEAAGVPVQLQIAEGDHLDSTWQAAIARILASIHPAPGSP